MTVPELLEKALQAAERFLSENANRQYRNTLSFYSTMLLGEMVALSEQTSNGHQSLGSNDAYSFEKLVEFVTQHFPLSECIRSIPNSTILDEIKDIAWEIEGCVLETITYIVNEMNANPYAVQLYADLPSTVRIEARKHLTNQLVDLGVRMDHVYVRQFIMGLLAHRWKLFAKSLEEPSSVPSSDTTSFSSTSTAV